MEPGAPCTKLHPDIVARQYVADVHLEDVLALLLQQHGGLSFALRRFVHSSRNLLLADIGGDEAVTDTRAHRVYRRPGGRRKYIARLERDLPFVLVLLRDDDLRDHAEHTNLDVRGLQRQRVDRGIRVFEGEVRTQGLVVGSWLVGSSCSDPDDEDCKYCNHHPACFSDGLHAVLPRRESTRETA